MRQFSNSDQELFAQLAGDRNPMHMDAAAARKTQAGAPVVHGMHILLWALDSLSASGTPLGSLDGLNADFKKFAYVGQPVSIRTTPTKVEIVAGDVVLITVRLTFGARKLSEGINFTNLPIIEIQTLAPASLDITDVAGQSGRLLPASKASELSRLFPNLAADIGVERVQALALLSTLVGMVCPGLHSIFSGVVLDLVDSEGSEGRGIGFKVADIDDRFRAVTMSVAGSGFVGSVRAFVRWPPVQAAPFATVAQSVRKGEFSTMRALIVGGSRGLGAVTAKIIAAGGGKVLVTYREGKPEAAALQNEIGADACQVAPLDVRNIPPLELPGISDINTVFYFATPQIFRQKQDVFEPEILEDFLRIYVHGFHDLCHMLLARSTAPRIAVLYPSSVAVEQRPKGITEYAMAKAAGEILAVDLAREHRRLRVFTPRIPRVLTDQTATVSLVESADPVDVLLPLARSLASSLA